MNLREQLSGTGVAIITPFKANESVDFDALGKLIDFIIDNGVDYVVSLGTTGETPTLDKQERLDIIQYTFERINGRIPVVIGIGGNNTKAVVNEVQNYPLDKAVAVLSTCPYYNKPSQEGIFQHYMALAEASPLPIIIYNVPSRTSSNMTAETTLRLAHGSDKFIAVKEASDDIYQIMKILKGRPDNFLVFSGDDFITLPLIAAGGDGVISVIANTLPRPFTDMVRAALRQDLVMAQKLNFKLLELYKVLFAEGNPVGVKAAMELQGLCNREVRLPLVPMSEQGVHAIMAELEKLER